MQRIKLCSMCSEEIHSGAFVSRRDNKTQICALCAAFEDWYERAAGQRALQQRADTHSALPESLPL